MSAAEPFRWRVAVTGRRNVTPVTNFFRDLEAARATARGLAASPKYAGRALVLVRYFGFRKAGVYELDGQARI